MLVAIDSAFPPYAFAFAEAIEDDLVRALELPAHAVQLHDVNPFWVNNRAWSICPDRLHSPLATFLDYCSKARAAMDFIEHEDLNEFHIVANWLDSAMAAQDKMECRHYAELFSEISRLEAQAHIHLNYNFEKPFGAKEAEDGEILFYGLDRVRQNREVLSFRARLPNRAPTLSITECPWRSDDLSDATLTNVAVEAVIEFLGSFKQKNK
mgnify:CR=1 FL=1